MTEAAAAGVLPPQFWHLTLREMSACLRASRLRDRRARELAISQAWHVAAFSRAERLPSLKSVLAELNGTDRVTKPEDMREFFHALTIEMGGTIIDRRKKG
ncbi:MAG TPA: hypothetical protein VKA19_07615 [Alphaproteobacteria bacterium]|nr:hypothetical protein [Alphaproteobacteria bacterium]